MAIPDITKSTFHVTAHQVTATIPTAGANATTTVDATLTGVKVGDIVQISGPTVALTHLIEVRACAMAADTISIFGLADATGFTGASKVYNVHVYHKS